MGHYSRNLLSKYEFYVFNYNLLCLFPILNGNMEVLEKRAYLKPSTGTAAYEGLGTTVSGIHLNTVTVV